MGNLYGQAIEDIGNRLTENFIIKQTIALEIKIYHRPANG